MNSIIPCVGMSSTSIGRLSCFYCKRSPILRKKCNCVAYYVMSTPKMTRLLIHVGTHDHIVQRGIIRAHVKELRSTVEEMVRNFSGAGPRHLQLTITKRLVTSALMHEEGVAVTNTEFLMMLEELEPLVQKNRYEFSFNNQLS